MKDPGLALAYFSALLHTLITGLSFLFTKTALVATGPIDVLAFRFTASLMALLVLIISKRIHLNYSGKNLLQVFFLALLYPIAFFGFQTFGLVHATSSEGGILLSVTPIFTMILAAVFFKGKYNCLSENLDYFICDRHDLYFCDERGRIRF